MLSQQIKDYLTNPSYYIEGQRASWAACQEKRLTLHQEQIVLAVAPVHYDLSSRTIQYPILKVVYDGTDRDFLYQYKTAIYDWQDWQYRNTLIQKYRLSSDDAHELASKISHIKYCAICHDTITELWQVYWSVHPLHWPT